MKTTVINFKTDSQLKRQAQEKAEELGLSLSAVLNTYLRRFLRTKRVEFEESLEPSEYLKNSIAQSKKDIKEGYVSPAFRDAKDVLQWLNDPEARYKNGKKVRDN